jgi:hypothetical protein
LATTSKKIFKSDARQKSVDPSSRRNESQVVIQQRMPEGDRDQLRPTMMTDQARHELLHAGLLARWSTDPRQDDRPAADHPYIQHRSVTTTLNYPHTLAELEMHTRMKLVTSDWDDVREELEGDAKSAADKPVPE